MTPHHIVNDVTQLNPVRVMAIVAPESTEDVQEALRRTSGIAIFRPGPEWLRSCADCLASRT